MTPQDFITKWKRATLSERSGAQQHFLDLCALLGQPTPAAADPEGAWYTFERGVNKIGGGKGWADVWMRERFAWEYKGKHKDLGAAYDQLLRYREDLENPPLLVVCDLDRFEVHTNFTNTVKQVYAFDLRGLAEPANLDVLRKVFTNPEALRPKRTTRDITEEIAAKFGVVADGLRSRGIPAERAAHFLMKLMFCMFAQDIGLLPDKLFSKVLAGAGGKPATLARRLKNLFEAMANGGEFGADAILNFDGGLFVDADVVELIPEEVEEVNRANGCDWSNVEPTIFGTLFERTLDPDKRSQIGAHYTSKEDILILLEPVLMAPIRQEWEAGKADCDRIWRQLQAAARQGNTRKAKGFRQSFEKTLTAFAHRLENVTVLDPACGSGNFLYVAINLLLDLEKQVVSYGSAHDFSWFPHVRPNQLAGLEINPYAQQLAQVVIWIGYLQWMHHNGFKTPSDPVLEPIENIRRMDAILDLSDPERPAEPEWPAAEFIVGNPPFLGGKKMRGELGDAYMDSLFQLWRERVRPEADLCCYWFEKARQQIADGTAKRVGLLATQGIRGGANRDVLKRIKETGDIFFAESDRDWILDGANVHISMVGFDAGTETTRTLDGKPAAIINANLSAAADITAAARLPENFDVAFMGDTKGGAFDIPEALALEMLRTPNPHRRPSSDVVVPWVNGLDITRRPRRFWIIDFGVGTSEGDAARFDRPFEHVRAHVKPARDTNARKSYRRLWWQHVEARPAMRERVLSLPRFIATARVAKHRLFVWMQGPTLPDCQLFAFARDDDFCFGVLHSRAHEVWARSQGTQVRERESGFRYTPTSCVETFPFPHPSGVQQAAIDEAARELDGLRTNWLNPAEWTKEEVLEFPGSTAGPWSRYVHDADAHGIGTVRYPRRVPRDEDCARRLQKRTLTNLYNERPAWLDQAHRKLNAAVFAAYGWPPELSDEENLAKLLALNRARAVSKVRKTSGRP
jgi:hypothetical protein